MDGDEALRRRIERSEPWQVRAAIAAFVAIQTLAGAAMLAIAVRTGVRASHAANLPASAIGVVAAAVLGIGGLAALRGAVRGRRRLRDLATTTPPKGRP
jgi:hypothetical protein